MQKTLLLFLCWLAFGVYAQAQERLISGRLKADDGSPLPGVSIAVKGTTKGTTTDANGYYQITAPIGSTLVISFIGFTTREVLVTEKNSTASGNQKKASSKTTKEVSQPQASVPKTTSPEASENSISTKAKTPPPPVTPTGVATMSENSPVYITMTEQGTPLLFGTAPIRQPYSIRYMNGWRARLRYGSQARNGVYIVDTRPGVSIPFQLSLTTSFAVTQINRLPALQNEYAQGRPQTGVSVWRGPETGEIFSWGSKARNLEYVGNATAFDSNGSLTDRGNGNGNPAQVYNPYTFFRKGSVSEQTLTFRTKIRDTHLKIGFTNQSQQKVIPNAYTDSQKWTFYGKRTLFSMLDVETGLFYTRLDDRLPNRNGNWTRLMASVMQTPPTFDNANGLSSKQAATNPASYLLTDGQFRTSGVGQTDNPFALVNLLPDRDTRRNLLTHLTFNLRADKFNILLKGSLENQHQRTVFGVLPGMTASTNGRLTERFYRSSHRQLTFIPSYDNWLDYGYNFRINTQVSYVLTHQQDQLNRKDGFGFGSTFQMDQADSLLTRQARPFRQMHELTESIQLKYKGIAVVNVSNLSYFSNTYASGDAWLPSAGVAFYPTELTGLGSSSFFSSAKLFANYSQNLQEAPLVYNQWQYNSTAYSSANYRNYTESQEIVSPQLAKPEHSRKAEFGFELQLLNHRVEIAGNYFTHLTRDALVPVMRGQTARLENLATLENKGSEWKISTNQPFGSFRFFSSFSFQRVIPLVKALSGSETRLPIAGFSDISSNLMAGQLYGVLVGSTWKRNENGQIIIGSDGFPLVDSQPRILGNPNPKWTAATEQTLFWRGWSLNLRFDFRHGGMTWNGTQAALNYLGASQLTQQQRVVRDYLFEGVLENGKPNGNTVDFANPAGGLETNRWVRYGVGGVGEESLQKTSWVRLNELKISYSLPHQLQNRLRLSDAKISLTGRNLWLWTPYTGVDPAATLFGYGTATGLDLFNAPSLRSYGIALHVSI
jgi:hypothetical protein